MGATDAASVANGGAGDASKGPTGTGGTAGSGGTSTASGGSPNGMGGVGGAGTGGKGSGGASSGSGGANGTAGSADGGGPKSVGCGKTGAKTGDFTLSVAVGSATRSFEVIVSDKYDPNSPVPLSFVFHGLNGNSGVAKAFGLQDAATKVGDIGVFAFPNGVSQGSDIGWDDACGGSDTAFFDVMNEQLQAQYCIATHRVFVAGFSWGADFTNTLACCRGDQLRAVAPASGGLFTGGCAATGPAFRLTSGGTSDTYYSQTDFLSGVNHARTVNHCSATQTPVDPAPCQSYQGCDAGKPVIWCSYPSMGHQLPSGWADVTWAFLSGFQ